MTEERDASMAGQSGSEASTRAVARHGGSGRQPDGRGRCDFCRLPIPGQPATAERDGQTYTYCCGACRTAARNAETVSTQYHGFRRVSTGVDPLDESLPQGIPRNSFVLLTDLAGTRTEAIQAELVWRTLRRDEPAVFVSFLEPPVSVVQEFVTLDWNVLPYLESGQLQIVDCFTYRLENRERMYDRFNDWNAFLSETAAEATTGSGPHGTGRTPQPHRRRANRAGDGRPGRRRRRLADGVRLAGAAGPGLRLPQGRARGSVQEPVRPHLRRRHGHR
jgi:hypothetical protein